MPDWSRRRTLSNLAGGLAVALAGCRGTADGESAATDESRIDDYEVERVRNGDGAALFTSADDLEEARSGGYHHLTDAADVEALTFADVPEAKALREFSVATDFESESVYLYARGVPECYDYRLRRVGVDENGPTAHFCRDLRPADAECDADARDTVGYAIRLPFPGDEYSGLGSGVSSSCSRPVRPEPFAANVTLADGGDGR